MESYFRASQSLLFQLNKKWIPKHLEILRIIDRRWEENLFYIRLDNETEDNWLMLIYLRDGNPDKQFRDRKLDYLFTNYYDGFVSGKTHQDAKLFSDHIPVSAILYRNP